MIVDYELESRVKQYLHDSLTAFINYEDFVQDKELQSIIHKRYCKVSRIRKRLVYLLGYRQFHYFCTFTFDDSYINKSDRTKRDLIKNCLNSFSKDILYILNVDFGKQTEREHYHCVVGTNTPFDLITYLKTNYCCFSHCQRIRLNGSDIKRVSKYINKLTNHCCKDSTKNKRVVYNFRGFDDMKKEHAFYWYTKIKYKLGL